MKYCYFVFMEYLISPHNSLRNSPHDSVKWNMHKEILTFCYYVTSTGTSELTSELTSEFTKTTKVWINNVALLLHVLMSSSLCDNPNLKRNSRFLYTPQVKRSYSRQTLNWQQMLERKARSLAIMSTICFCRLQKKVN